MIITDFITLEKIKEVSKDTAEKIAKGKAIVEAVGIAETLADRNENHQVRRSSQSIFKELRQTAISEVRDVALDAAVEAGDFSSIAESCYNWSLANRLNGSAVVSMTEIRRIADILGFVVIPYEYLSRDACKDEEYEVKSAIDLFNNSTKDNMNVYVLAPVTYYDIRKHIDSASDRKFYAGSKISQAMMAISMAIPVFRSLTRRINGVEGEMRSVQEDLSGLESRMGDLEVSVKRMHQEAMQAKSEALAITELASASRETYAYDPMMFAFSKNISVNDDGAAFLGPCWGGDFEDILIASLGLDMVKGQREMLHKKTYPNQESRHGQWDRPGYGRNYDPDNYGNY